MKKRTLLLLLLPPPSSSFFLLSSPSSFSFFLLPGQQEGPKDLGSQDQETTVASVEDLAVVVGVMVMIEAMALVGAVGLMEVNLKTRSRCLSPGWTTGLRT